MGLSGIWILWLCRNKLIFDREMTKKETAIVEVRSLVMSCDFMIKEKVSSSVRNLEMLKSFNFNPRFKQSVT